MRNTNIEWADDTFNPWIGCEKVSPGCAHCYAERFTRWTGQAKWGRDAERVRTSEKNWQRPFDWNKEARRTGRRRRVFCASMADVFERNPQVEPFRNDLWNLIRQTTALDWLLLTKRADAIRESLPDDWGDGYANVWPMVTVEDQDQLWRIDELVRVPAVVRGLSVEPLIGPLNLELLDLRMVKGHTLPITYAQFIHWVIVGGESGKGARPFHVEWARDIIDQCHACGVAVFIKQLGSNPYQDGKPLKLADKKGGDPAEWPEDLCVRELPRVARIEEVR